MTASRTRGPLRVLSALVLAFLAAASVALSLTVHSVVADEQTRLLNARTEEAGVLVGTLFGSVGAALPTLATTAPPSPGATSDFTTDAHQYLGAVGAIGALQDSNGSFRVLASVGKGPRPGAVAAPDRAALARQALGTKGLVDAVVATPGGPRLSFALADKSGQVLYEDLAFDSAKPIDLGANGPFSELDGALYASPRPDPARLVITTTAHLPLSGQVDQRMVTVGNQHWVLVARSRVPLVGAFAADAPWAVLGAGLVAALLATVLVETLARRRSYAVGLVEERTFELREAQEAAEAANRAKSEFLSRMSHELRTPLNAILGFGQLLELDELGSDQREAVGQILKGGRHLLDLINEILDISRIETGNLALSPEAVSVADAVADVVTLMRPVADEHGVDLRSDFGAGHSLSGAHVLADRQRVKQILLNLVANAVKYNREAGQVVVAVESAEAGALRISVTDTGPGIRAEDQARLFTPFERLGAEATGVEGSGVGLALCRRLAEAMHGSVGMRSDFGQGSCFWVELPLTEGPVERYERLHGSFRDDAVADEVGLERRPTVLYIEDNLSNLKLIERLLVHSGDVVLVPAMQGRLGLALAREHQPDVILLDLHLPDMRGDQVLTHLRGDPATADIPVVVLSADATPGQAERLLASGAAAYLTKPLDVRQLLDVLSEHVALATAAQPN